VHVITEPLQNKNKHILRIIEPTQEIMGRTNQKIERCRVHPAGILFLFLGVRECYVDDYVTQATYYKLHTRVCCDVVPYLVERTEKDWAWTEKTAKSGLKALFS
jgi:hypothetical protein